MTISPEQLKNFKAAIEAGLRTFYRPPMLTCSEYADTHFYMSSESSYTEGRWESLPFQVGILNAMGNDEITTLNFMKSARVGYTKMLMANTAYKIEHKKRNVAIYQPKDGTAKKFMKAHVESAIRDIPIWRNLAPWLGKKHRDSTLDTKFFTNGKTLHVRGGTAADNFREISVDEVIYDELAAFLPDIEKEGNATTLGDTRFLLSVYPKSIRGSTPKVLGLCQMEKACSESSHHFHFMLPCPHCDELQRLKWGGKDEPFGIKWDGNDVSSVYYLCENNACVIENATLTEMQEHPDAIWICEKTGIKTKDFIEFYTEDGDETVTPASVAIYIWSAYNSLVSWAKLVSDFYNSKDDKEKLKTFVNTKLGEPWDEENGERLEWEDLARRREMYPENKVPNWVVYLTAGVDTQDDRYEGRIWGWGPNKEACLVDRFMLYGDPHSQVLLDKVAERLQYTYVRADGIRLNLGLTCWDSGGHYTDTVISMSKRLGIMKVIPIFGASTYGKPIANFPRKRNRKGVYQTEVGTDNAKDLIMSMLRIAPDVNERKAGAIHLPLNESICDDTELQQLTAERKIAQRRNGRLVYRWDAGGRRNEALDCLVYALAALYIAMERFGINLEKMAADNVPASNDIDELPEQPQTNKPHTESRSSQTNQWLGDTGTGGWL